MAPLKEKRIGDEQPPSNTFSPEDKANFFSRVFFWWINGLIFLGYRRPLEQDDLYRLPTRFETGTVYSDFLASWEMENQKDRPPSLARTLLRVHYKSLIFSGILNALYQASAIGGPMLLKSVITYVNTPSEPTWKGYLLAVGLGLLPIVGSLCNQHQFEMQVQLGMMCRAAVGAHVYRKSLRLSNAARQKSTTGQIVNLMSSDSQRFVEAAFMFHSIWSSPLVVIIVMALLIWNIGLPALAGVGTMLALFPLNGYIAKKLQEIRMVQVKVTDERVRMMNETLQGIRVIKFYAWEDSFAERMDEIRRRETALLKRAAFFKAWSMFFLLATPMLVATITFSVYAATNGTMDPAKIFTALALFGVLRFPLTFLPMVIATVVQLNISIKRLTDFFLLSEMDDNARTVQQGPGDAFVTVTKASFKWEAPPPAAAAAAGPGSVKRAAGPFGAAELEAASTKTVSKKKLSRAESRTVSRSASLVQRQSLWAKFMKNTKAGNRSSGVGRGDDPGSIGSVRVDVDQLAPAAPAEAQPVGEGGAADKGEGGRPTLRDISLEVPTGALVAIVGPVGSGKSSLIAGILGDIKKLSGNVAIGGRIAYVAQQAWIINASVRNNIVFGTEFDEERYLRTIDACALTKDIEMLPSGDDTEIGEKGINLSGGQKQRVSIARAVYSDADVYIFDDPLSAVDAHVGRHLFEKCINGVLKTKTRMLVTNQLHFLPYTDMVVVLKEGEMVEAGPYADLMRNDQAFAELMAAYGSHEKDAEETEKTETEEDKMKVLKSTRNTVMERTKSALLVKAEDRNTGTVQWKYYGAYLVAAGGPLFGVILISLFALSQGVQTMNDIWLSFWTSNRFPQQSTGFYIGIYAVWGVAYSIALLSRSLTMASGGIRAAKNLYASMFRRVIRAPTSFFDTTPIGRILNRFSKDTDQIDQFLPSTVEQWLGCLTSVIGTLCLISAIVPWFLIPLLPIAIGYQLLQQFYRRTSRELQRLESISKSPVYSNFSETLTGVSTIRAYGVQQRFVQFNDSKTDENNQAYYLSQTANRWLGMRLDVLGGLILFFAALMSVISKSNGIGASWVGLIITYSLSVTSVLNWSVRMSTETEAKLNSVERVHEYAHVAIERPAIIPDSRPPPEWPQKGRIEFEEVTMAYREGLEPVLKQVSFSVEPQQKIGIVGRTGSGKSSLMMALFRMVELLSGGIVIDGINIADIGLEDLRSHLAIIPQDPVLFGGTVRDNLDPFRTSNDAALWDVLEHAQLSAVIEQLPDKLDAKVAEGGDNFSVGQRQLICLARALLRKPKILVLDEATANIDLETDALIQGAIRSEFAECTVLTIAHRLNTVMDSDKVLVMEAGCVAQFDTPSRLLDDADGILAQMVGQTGRANSVHLRRLATGEISMSALGRSARAKSLQTSSIATDSVHVKMVPLDGVDADDDDRLAEHRGQPGSPSGSSDGDLAWAEPDLVEVDGSAPSATDSGSVSATASDCDALPQTGPMPGPCPSPHSASNGDEDDGGEEVLRPDAAGAQAASACAQCRGVHPRTQSCS